MLAAQRPLILLRGQVRTLESYLAAVRDGDPEGVHQARVATRQIRELLPLTSRDAGPLVKAFRSVGRSLGAVRDAGRAGLLAQVARAAPPVRRPDARPAAPAAGAQPPGPDARHHQGARADRDRSAASFSPARRDRRQAAPVRRLGSSRQARDRRPRRRRSRSHRPRHGRVPSRSVPIGRASRSRSFVTQPRSPPRRVSGTHGTSFAN